MKKILTLMSVELNGRTLNPCLEEAISVYEKEFMPAVQQLQKVSGEFPLSLEPAPIYIPEK